MENFKKNNITISENTKAIYSEETINKAIEILSILKGESIEDCHITLNAVKDLIYTNSNVDL